MSTTSRGSPSSLGPYHEGTIRATTIVAALGLSVAACGQTLGPASAAQDVATPPAEAFPSEPPAAGPLGPPQTPTPLPRPPQQEAAWSAPAAEGEVAALGEALPLLVAQGLADPRGCEYREVTLRVGSVWSGDGGLVETRGFVVPGAEREGSSYAIGWNGLVYAAEAVGPAVDLRADVAASLEAPPDDGPGPGTALEERPGIEARGVGPLRAALLLRLGEADLAERMWAAFRSRGRAGSEGSPFGIVAWAWAWATFDRALTSHMRGDDALALEDARRLTRAAPALEAREPAGLDLSFLAPLPALLADQERRAREAGDRHGPTPVGALASLPETERVAALVRELDQVSARQMGQPGGVVLLEDPIVRALVGVGEAAVEPLLATLEGDERLTRSVHFWRDFAPPRTVLGVHEAAYVALANILELSAFELAATGDSPSARGEPGRREVAARMRAHFERWRGVPIERRWYVTLADDSAGADGWVQAAEAIARPVDVEVRIGSQLGTSWVLTPSRPDGVVPALRGEALRSETSPAVTDLLARRIDELAASSTSRSLGEPCRLAAALVAWDRGASLPALQRLSARCVTTTPPCACFVALVTVRSDLGDRRDLARYAAWARTLDPSRYHDPAALLAPLWSAPDDPAMVALGAELFESEGSPYRPRPAEGPDRAIVGLARSPLVDVPAYRRHLLAMLGDRRPIATLTVNEGGTYTVRYRRGMWNVGVEDPASSAPPGSVLDLRVADLYGEALASVEGAPAFRACWPEARRDAALEALAAWLGARPFVRR